MDDLIARNRLLREIREVYEYEFPTASGDFDRFVKKILPNIICNQPTVYAIPVVRCKDCVHRNPEDKGCDCGSIARQGCLFPVDDNYFCGYGEWKGGEQECKD